MKSLLLFIAFFFTSATQALTRIDTVKVVDVVNGREQPGVVYVEGDRIHTVAQTSVPALDKQVTQVINGHGGYLIPAFTDTHVHLEASGQMMPALWVPLQVNLNNALYTGVTQMVDLFTSAQVTATVRDRKYAGPTVMTSGRLFTAPGGHGTQYPIKPRLLTDAASLEKQWAAHVREQPDVTKAVLETGEAFHMTYATLTADRLSELGSKSRAAGLPYFVHVSDLNGAKTAVKAGATVLAHGVNTRPIDAEFIRLMQENKVAYMPTFSVFFEGRSNRDTPLAKVLPPAIQRCLASDITSYAALKDTHFAIARDNLRKLYDAGVPIVAGSDAGNQNVPHGVGLHIELDLLAQAGLSPLAVLQSTTIRAAHALGKAGQFGEIKAGQRANFVVLRDNPLRDSRAHHTVEAVIYRGQTVDREALREANHQTEPSGQACATQENGSDALSRYAINGFNANVATLADIQLQGKSTASMRLHQDAQRSPIVEFSGTLKPGFRWGPFAQLQFNFLDTIDVSGYSGVKMTLSGTPGRYYMELHQPSVKDYDHFHRSFAIADEQPTTVTVSMKELRQWGFGQTRTLTPESIKSVVIAARAAPGQSVQREFTLKIFALTFY